MKTDLPCVWSVVFAGASVFVLLVPFWSVLDDFWLFMFLSWRVNMNRSLLMGSWHEESKVVLENASKWLQKHTNRSKHNTKQGNKKKNKNKKTPFFLSVNVFSTKVLIGDTIFTSPTGDGTAISTWSSEPREGPAVCSAKAVSFIYIFRKYHI